MQQSLCELKILNLLVRRFVSFLGDPSSAFLVKGWVLAKVPENVTNIADKSLEDAIEVGAEEVEPDEERPGYLKVEK